MRWVILLLLLAAPVAADWDSDAAFVDAALRDFIGEVDNGTRLVVGTHASPAERMMLAYAKQTYPIIESIPVVKDREAFTGDSLLLIGGPTQNRVAASLPAEAVETTRLTYGVYANATIDGVQYVILSDHAGYDNVPPKTARSPLSRVMPEEYVPAAAAFIGFSLLWLWKFLFAFGKRLLRLIVSSKVLARIRRRELKEGYRGFHVRGVRVKYREVAAIVLSAIIFAAAVATTYLSPALRWLIAATILSNIVIYAIRHGVRLVMDRHHELHTEYVLWPWGALVTVVSGWLGATFALAGYVVSDKEHDLEGKIAFWTDACSFLAALIFIVWNLLAPSVLLQMVSVLALTLSVVQMLPFEPFNGRRVLRWRRAAWWLLFPPMLLVYLLVIIL